ncbi:MAG TPA: hypothetical protein VGD54_10100, partial [Steroidobacteraceae bacterium]
MSRVHISFIALFLLPSLGTAQSAFDGTWRPDPQRPSQPGKPEVTDLANGVYECRSCTPPYTVKADGRDQPITGSPYYDTVNIAIIDDRTVMKSAKKDGKPVTDTKVTISANGKDKTEVQTLTGISPVPIELTAHYSRAGAGAHGSHLISGAWQLVEVDVSNHSEDTTFKVSGDTLSMYDRMGRSFSAKLDGTEAPYKGDPEFTHVSLKRIDDRTIEESDLNGGKVAKITRWTVSP